MNIIEILTRKYPDAEWELRGQVYEGLTWLSDSPKPTEQELQAAWVTVVQEIEYEKVEKARLEAYRETSDPLFFEYQRGDATKAEWLAAVQAVKDAHPYPEQV